ncbi:MAG TPA: hypothetical protein VKE53_11785 [Pseudolabrys sp.]|nr:hypothetical protein [Pseudolabrys sp.]
MKIVPAPEARISPEAKADTSSKTSLLKRLGRNRLRMILLVGLLVLAVIIRLDIYLSADVTSRPTTLTSAHRRS